MTCFPVPALYKALALNIIGDCAVEDSVWGQGKCANEGYQEQQRASICRQVLRTGRILHVAIASPKAQTTAGRSQVLHITG